MPALAVVIALHGCISVRLAIRRSKQPVPYSSACVRIRPSLEIASSDLNKLSLRQPCCLPATCWGPTSLRGYGASGYGYAGPQRAASSGPTGGGTEKVCYQLTGSSAWTATWCQSLRENLSRTHPRPASSRRVSADEAVAIHPRPLRPPGHWHRHAELGRVLHRRWPRPRLPPPSRSSRFDLRSSRYTRATETSR
jgi:hypothetical protein